jgi:subtilisin family serine protease
VVVSSKRWQAAMLILLLSFFILFSPSQTLGIGTELVIDQKISSSLEKEDYVPVIVVLKEKADLEKALKQQKDENPAGVVVSSLQDTAQQAQDKIRSLLEEELDKGNIKNLRTFWVVNAFAAEINKEGLKKLTSFPEIEQITMDQKIHRPAPFPQEITLENNFELMHSSPSSPDKSSNGYPWNLAQINVPRVWEAGIYGRGIVVAIMDTGVELEHPALLKNYRGFQPGQSHNTSWFNVGKTDSDGEGPEDLNGHGTHIAGIIVGGTTEAPLGIAPGAKWIAANIFTKGYAWDSHIMEAFQWFLAPGGDPANAPDIINCSWSSRPEYVKDYLQWEILHNLEQAGITVFFAAGNNAEEGPGSPASYPHAFSVGAVKKEGDTIEITDFSSRGPVNWQDAPYVKPEIVAPGSMIESAWLNNGYTTLEGTSTAVAHVSGVAALLLESSPNLTPRQIAYLLKTTAFWNPVWDAYGKRPNNTYGNGLLDAYAALSHIAVLPEEEVLFEDGAEEGILNWNTSPAFPWKITRENVHSGNFAFADSPWEKYKNNTLSWFSLAKPIDLCGYHSPVLSFWHFYDLQEGKDKNDYGYVEISVDGKNWISLYSFSGSNEKTQCSVLPLDLPQEAQKLYFRFRLESNNNGPGGGWTIDDISLTAIPLPLTALERLKLIPERYEIGVGENIEIKADAVFSPQLAKEIDTGMLQFSSSNPLVAKIENGIITGISAGEATISGLFGNKTANFKIRVFDLGEPVARPLSGTFVDEVEVTLESALEDSKIYYSLDGSLPDSNSTLYEKPIIIHKTTTLNARTYLHGIAGPPATFSYTIKEGTTVKGSILLQGRPFQASNMDVFFRCNEEGTKYQIPSFTKEGRFTMKLPYGSYKLTAQKQHFLTRTIPVELSWKNKEMLELKPLTLLAGDLNNDNKIDLADLALLALAYHAEPGDKSWNPAADLNGDGLVNATDLKILNQNYGLVGDSR